ncbi:MAG TPA: MFS transporter [Planctomycetota bacterium]|jgi:nucleoside transporter|nr:MFS transporter [Planctomycetota bacterium]
MSTKAAVVPRLSVMMFLQYAIWGAWLPILWPFLADHRGFSATQIANMFAVGAIGALLAPFVAGQIADRFFATEKFLGLSHLAGALLVWQLAGIESYSGFLRFSLLYSIVYAPTLALTNSLAFHHLEDRDRQFGKVRVWGTVGWIAVGIAVGQWLLHRHTPSGAGVTAEMVKAAQAAGRADAFRLSAILGLVMGVYCFFLPHTPPTPGKQENASLEALSEIRKDPLLTLFVISVPISCIHQFYFVHTSGFLSVFQNQAASAINDVLGVGGGGLMTIGQMSELFVLAGIPLVAKKVSRKSLLLVGCAAYALRMALFAYVHVIPAPPIATLVAGVALHGLCFGCFIFVAFMIVDEETSADVRASAQSLYNLVIIGVGIIVGSLIAGRVSTWAQGASPKLDYADPAQTRALFSVPMWGAVACFLLLLAFYPARQPGNFAS